MNNKNLKKTIFSSLILLLIFSSALSKVYAQEENEKEIDRMDSATSTEALEDALANKIVEQMITVSPSIIDVKFQKSDLDKYSIKLKNNSDKKLDIYAMVNNISPTDGKLEFSSVTSKERSSSAANWILIKRGSIVLMPYEEVTVPLEIRVAINALPGKYYVSVSFPYGQNRKNAEESMTIRSYAETRINIDVDEGIIEKAQIKRFVTSKNLYLTKEIDFGISIENIGNRTINPNGFIYIFNRKGEEVTKIEITKEENSIGQNQTIDIRKTWSGQAKSGKYKARVELEYGKESTRDLQDTIYFWVLPWKLLLLFIALMIVLVSILTFVIFKKTYKRES